MKSTFVDYVRSMADRAPAGRRQQLRDRRRGFTGRVIEALEGRVLMHANAVEDAEHVAVFGSHNLATGAITGGLVPDSSMTDVSKQCGDWSDPNTWSNGVPTNFANVLITAGTTVPIQ